MAGLKYSINLEEANWFREHITTILNIINLPTQEITQNERTWEIRHPRLVNQFGAIYLGGDEKSVQKFDAVAYFELRFFKAELKNLGVLEEFSGIYAGTDFRTDTETLLRFRLDEIDYDVINKILTEIHAALYAFKS